MDYKLELALERLHEAEEKQKLSMKELKELAKRKRSPEPRPPSAKKAKAPEAEQPAGQVVEAAAEGEAPTSAPSKVSFHDADPYSAS